MGPRNVSCAEANCDLVVIFLIRNWRCEHAKMHEWFVATRRLFAGELHPRQFALLECKLNTRQKDRLICFALHGAACAVLASTSAMVAFFAKLYPTSCWIDEWLRRVPFRPLSLAVVLKIIEVIPHTSLLDVLACCLDVAAFCVLRKRLMCDYTLSTYNYFRYQIRVQKTRSAELIQTMQAISSMAAVNTWLLRPILASVDEQTTKSSWTDFEALLPKYYDKGIPIPRMFVSQSWAQRLTMWRCTGRVDWGIVDHEFLCAHPEVVMDQIVTIREEEPALRRANSLITAIRRQENARRLAALMICAEHFALVRARAPSRIWRFFRIARRLPMEVQVLLAGGCWPNDKTYRWLFDLPQRYDIGLLEMAGVSLFFMPQVAKKNHWASTHSASARVM